jgi:predicted nucleic acid-binding protein
VLAILENGRAIGHVSPNIVTNLYYILRKAGGDAKARNFLGLLLKFLTVVPVDHTIVLNALGSEFLDFEDAVQNYSAVENQCSTIVTRNREDYKASELVVLTPSEFIGDFT